MPPKYKPLEDESPMPFGKHGGTPMIDLPISYLVWILDECSPGNVKDWAKKNEKWIRAEKESGKHNRPTRVSQVTEEKKPQPPDKMTSLAFIAQEMNIDLNTVDPAQSFSELGIDMCLEAIARLAQRYKNYFNGTPNLIPLPKKEQPKGDNMLGWGEENFDGVKITDDDLPF